jgi:probable HAF family extracellular repeat protein
MRHPLLCASCLIVGVLVVRAGGAPAVPGYLIVDLGTLGGSETQPVALNERGEVTGWSRTPDNAQHAFLFANGKMLDLGTLGGSISRGNAINDDGEVAGTASTASSTHGFLYTGGRIHDLGTIGGDFSEAVAINASGQVTGRSSTADGHIHGFLFSSGSMIDLGTLGGPGDSEGVAINASGQITGSADLAVGLPFPHEARHVFLYSGGVMNDISGVTEPELPSLDPPSRGLAINDLGHVLFERDDPTEIGEHLSLFLNSGLPAVNIGFFFAVPSYALNSRDQIAGTELTEPLPEHGFLFSDGVLTDLTPVDPGGGANALNNAGDAVGFQNSFDQGTHAFLFAHGSSVDLNSLVPSGSAVLVEAVGINDKGQIICRGFTPGHTGGFLLNPVDRIASTKDQCRNGGWAELMRANGSAFRNQGDCVSYVNTGK